MPLWLFSCCTVPKYSSISQWHCANVSLYIYFLVALCQSMPLWLFSCCTVPIPAYTCMHLDSFKSIVGTAPPSLSPSPTSMTIFLWHCANTCLYIYFLVALCQSIPLYPSGTVPKYTMAIFLWHCDNTCLYDYFPVALWQYLLIHVCIFIVLKVITAPPSLSPSPSPFLGREARQ